MARILVFGGTRFFGKKLVQRLLDHGHAVTVATRGIAADPFGERVERLIVDREQPASIAAATAGRTWDVVYDNICFSPDEASAACELFAGRVQRYVLTSTMAVYEQGETARSEGEFDPCHYPLQSGPKTAFSYAEGKRLAEAVLFQRAPFPVCAVRFPIVLGHDDYTRRLHFHVEHVRQGKAIGMPNRAAAMSFITSAEAADFLAWLADHFIAGPVNACSRGTLSLDAIVRLIEQAVDKPARIETHTADAHMSPFGVPQSWILDASLAERSGYTFRHIDDWYPALIKAIAMEG